MKWLLWKDYRHNRLIVFAALVLLVVPYLIGIAGICLCPWFPTVGPNGELTYSTTAWTEIIGRMAGFSVLLSQFTMALLGGNAISGERVDGSSQFVYSLPVTRRKLLASKLLFAAIVTAVIWLANIAIFLCLMGALPKIDEGVCYAATTGLTFFCVAWCLSSFVASPALDVCGGIIAPAIVGSGIHFGSELLHVRVDGDVLWQCYLITFFVLAAVCFAAGTWRYLRRVEP
jgi:ABC-type transport system involved in multi-copper enzyme maturation permease subunit